MPVDLHSFAIPEEARVRHLRWKATVDFRSRTIHATATWEIESNTLADTLVLDTKGLTIDHITLNDNQPTGFRFAEPDALLGEALTIMIRPDTKRVNIVYQTSPDAEALQWLQPQQTSGKQHPFLFTQSQAILARSWIPCQDSPGIRFTYDADVQVPEDLLPLMSASNPQRKNSTGVYHFEMQQPIPAYLLALSVGDVSFQAVSERCGVYAEPVALERASWEFQDLENMVIGAESLYGAYPWERYDVIVLPHSFPFGGMENPRLTFATPTILAGDRSLTSLIAHELAHSWSGNLVTNATWDDFWLNEGFTVYFEHRIMEKLYGRDYAEMLAVLSLQDLNETLLTFKAENKEQDTCLKLHLEGRNPDEGVTDIAYIKGYFFLRSIEEKYGRAKFDAFVKDYFSDNAFSAMNTEKFIVYIKKYFQSHYRLVLEDLKLNEWIYDTGLPSNCPNPVSGKLKKVEAFLEKWNSGEKPDVSVGREWSTHEWLHFLKNLPEVVNLEQMEVLDNFGNFTSSGNAEITTLWLVMTIRNQYHQADSKLEQFLINTGRRKFLIPLYRELLKSANGRDRAIEIYAKARPNYHFVARNTFDALLK
ncbi:MAG: M1 family metallopeptidase [Cyclobacteriaceae bacterium]|nr:M1 family metallopeptidase [Cyclobacteriaceae bacterium]MDH4294964.1 M1 family metallopeptidase [Cyclobacteriaceae bacterium]MDH5250047.1 M1 family metallopeptidase [Cyclobacteriaceae bacterium]